MAEPMTEILFDGARIVLADADGDSVWLTRIDKGGIVVESDELYVELNAEQSAALRAWVSTETQTV